MIAVTSSNINSYNVEKDTLTIKFKNGNVYEFYAVPESVIEDFKRAESKGSFFFKHIKGKFGYKKL